MTKRKLIVAIPRGSLNRREENRGWTALLLKHAGWELDDYKPGTGGGYYPRIRNGERWLRFVTSRPRDMPDMLMRGSVDLAICGRDTMEEFYSSIWIDVYNKPGLAEVLKVKASEHLNEKRDYFNFHRDIWGHTNRRIKEAVENGSEGGPYELCDLGYGQASLHLEIDLKEKDKRTSFKGLEKIDGYGNLKETLSKLFSLEDIVASKKSLICATEYPKIAYGQLIKYFPSDVIEIRYSEMGFSRNKPKPVVICSGHGNETSIPSKRADIVLECVVSGKRATSHIRFLRESQCK